MRKSKYSYNIINSSPYPTISFDKDETSTPEYVYKYYGLNERNISAILSQRCYASIPGQLNDLFDTLFLRIRIYESQSDTYRGLIENGGLKFDEIEFKESQAYRETLRNSLFAIWNSKIGILSTTDDPLNDLMWAHYTNNEGFLVQWDYELFPDNFGKPIPVSYFSREDFSRSNNKDVITALFENSLTKKEIWTYENEFRFLIFPRNSNAFLTSGGFSNEDHYYQRESRLQKYPLECIKKVMLGFNFFTNLLTNNSKLDFSKPTGILKKSLLDWITQNQIDVELILIDCSKMELVPRRFVLTQISELEYKIDCEH